MFNKVPNLLAIVLCFIQANLANAQDSTPSSNNFALEVGAFAGASFSPYGGMVGDGYYEFGKEPGNIIRENEAAIFGIELRTKFGDHFGLRMNGIFAPYAFKQYEKLTSR